MYFDGSHYVGIPKQQRPSYVHLWENIPEFGASAREVWLDCTTEHLYPDITCGQQEPDSGSDVFWYNDGKRQIPLTDGNAELPKEIKFESIKGEQQEIDFDGTSDEYEDEIYTDDNLDVYEPKKEKKLTLKDVFNELYKYAVNLPRKERNEFYRDNLIPFFTDEEQMQSFIRQNLERKKRNLILRRIRMTRKANLADFNYFCTFTYSDKLHDEVSFKKKLRATFRNLCYRKGWKYMGVWERSPEKQRLHFHGLFYIPEGQMVGEVKEIKDYSVRLGRVQVSHQNTYFNERFGRSDFDEIVEKRGLVDALAYLMKYIEKTGEKIVYSKGLPQYFIADIAEDDVATRVGIENRKLLLFDNFACYKDQQYVGTVSKQTIGKLETSN